MNNNQEEEKLPAGDDSHIYVVQNGDTLQSIAVRFDVTVSWLLQINHMFSDFILPGDTIKVWKHDVEEGYIKDIPARLVDPNNIEGHSPHGHLFLYPDRIVFNAEIRDESLTILFDGIKDIDIIIHPFNEITAIPATPLNTKPSQYSASKSAPSSLPSNMQSPLSLKEIKPEELLYLMMINYDESKIIHSGTEVNVTDFSNGDELPDNSKFDCVFFSSMRKYIEPFKHELVTAVNKKRIESAKKKKEEMKINKNDNIDEDGDNKNENESSDLNQEKFLEKNEQVKFDIIKSDKIDLLEDADTWVPDYYKAPSKQTKRRFFKDKEDSEVSDTDNEGGIKKKFKKKRIKRSDSDMSDIGQKTISTPNFDAQFQKRFSTPKPLLPIELINGPSSILLNEDSVLIRRTLPYRFRNGNWNLLYQLSRDGTSYYTFFSRTQKKLPVILLILTDKDEKIGAYLSTGIHESSRYYGSGETFIFRLSPHYECFKWSQANNYFISSTSNEILIGGGGASAIWIDSKMSCAYSGECETFSSPSLTSEPNFNVTDMEVWSLDPFGSYSTNAILKPTTPDGSSSSSLGSNQNS